MAIKNRRLATYSLPPDVIAAIRELAERENRPISRQVEIAIRGHLTASGTNLGGN